MAPDTEEHTKHALGRRHKTWDVEHSLGIAQNVSLLLLRMGGRRNPADKPANK